MFVVAVVCIAGCSTTHYAKSADKEAYRVLAEKTPGVPGMDPNFTIEAEALPPLDGLPAAEGAPPYLGEAGTGEAGAHVLSLEKALELAVKHNRQYQNEKESLYLQALSLTLDRHRYTPIFSGAGEAAYGRSTRDAEEFGTAARLIEGAPDLINQLGALTGTPGDLLSAYGNLVQAAGAAAGLDRAGTRIVDERDVSGGTALGVDLLLKGGGRIAVNLTTNFLRFLTGDPRVDNASALVGSFTQPILRGGGRKVAAEQLTQAERNLLYQLREFTRYRQEFTVRICSSYYGVLQDRDVARNNWQAYQSFIKNAERQRAFAEEGRLKQAELGRVLQAELSSENNWVGSVRRYKQSLDAFKIELGLSTDAQVVLDDKELRDLAQRGIIHPRITTEEAVEVATTARLDLYTQRDQREDAARRVDVAANALKPGLDLVVGTSVSSLDNNRFSQFDFNRARLNVGLDTDLPLERKSERNQYRGALIEQERSIRELELAGDNVKLEVRNAWRELDQAKRAYEIAQQTVELNKRRVEEQDLLAELGQVIAQNQVDAQNDLNESMNNLTAALIGHTIARLEFWRDMGILFIKENGQWEEVTDGES
jgi:outer membrane protein TolC